MAQLLYLEEFTNGWDRSTELTDPHGEKQHLASYEQGYQAGYDDAAQSAMADQTRISAELSLNLQDLGFTFHEARSHVINSLEPLLCALADKLLPDLVAHSIGQVILEELVPMAEAAADTPIEVVVGPNCRSAIEPILTAVAGCPLHLIEEPSLGPGQAYLRSGKIEKIIDLQSTMDAMKDAMAALARENSEVFSHG